MRPSRPKPDNTASSTAQEIQPRQIRILARRPKLHEVPPPPTVQPISFSAPLNNPSPLVPPGFRPRQPRPTLQQLEELKIQVQAASTTVIPSPVLQNHPRPPTVQPSINTSHQPKSASSANDTGSSSANKTVHTNNPISHSSSTNPRSMDATALEAFKKNINDARKLQLNERDANKRLTHNTLLLQIFNRLDFCSDYAWLYNLEHDFLLSTLRVISEILESVIKIRQFGVDLDFSDREFGGNELRVFLIPFFENFFKRIEFLDYNGIPKNDFVNFCLYVGKLMGKLPANFIERIERDLNNNEYNETDLSMLRNAFLYLCTFEQLQRGEHPHQQLHTQLAKKRVALKNLVIDQQSLQSIIRDCLSSANIATTNKLFKILMSDPEDTIKNFSITYLLTLIWDLRRLESILNSENKTTEQIDLIRKNWQVVKDHLLLKLYAIFTSDNHFLTVTIKEHINNLLCFYNLGVADTILQEYLDRIDQLDTCSKLSPMELSKVKEVIKKRNLSIPANIKKRFACFPGLYRNDDDKLAKQEDNAKSPASNYLLFNPSIAEAVAKIERQFLDSAMQDMFIRLESDESDKSEVQTQKSSTSNFNPNQRAFTPSSTQIIEVDEQELSQFKIDITKAKSLLLGERDQDQNLIHFQLLKRIISSTFKYKAQLANLLDDDNCLNAVIVIAKFLEQTMKIHEFGVVLDLSNKAFANCNLKESLDAFLKACFAKLLQGSYHKSLFANICYHICKLRGYLPTTYKQRIDTECHLYNAFELGILRDALAFLCPLEPPYDSFHQHESLYHKLLSQENLILVKISVDQEMLKHTLSRCIRLANFNLIYLQELLVIFWDTPDDLINRLQTNYLPTLLNALFRMEQIIISKEENDQNKKIRQNWKLVKDQFLPKLCAACIQQSNSTPFPLSVYHHANNLNYLQTLGLSVDHLKKYLHYLSTFNESKFAELGLKETQFILNASNFCQLTLPPNILRILLNKIGLDHNLNAQHWSGVPIPLIMPGPPPIYFYRNFP